MMSKNKQQGFSLFMVMILMLVIAVLVMVSVQSSTTEMRASTNEADRKFAVSLAENGLRDAESRIGQISKESKIIEFTSSCTDGYCATADKDVSSIEDGKNFRVSDANPSTVPAWERCADNSDGSCKVGKTVLDKGCDAAKKCFSANDDKVKYIIEYLGNRKGTDASMYDYFRVTSRAHGNNQDTIVTLQSYVELHTP